MTKLHVYKLVLASANSDYTNYQLFSFYNSSKTRSGIKWSLKKILMDRQTFGKSQARVTESQKMMQHIFESCILKLSRSLASQAKILSERNVINNNNIRRLNVAVAALKHDI